MTWVFARIGRAILTLLLLIAFTFFTLAISGDPAVAKFGEDIDMATLEAFRAKWGLNYPLWKQFLIYLNGIVHLDFGVSFRTGEPAWGLVVSRLPATLSLMLPTMVFSILIGVPLGVFAAMNRGKWADRFTIVLAVVALAIPSFLLGLLLMFVFSVWLAWLPPSGIVGWQSYIMPSATLAIATAAIYARFTRSAMVEVLSHPMIETAQASGLSRRVILCMHGLPNVLLPLITISALEFGNILTFAIVVESVFSWPGVGRLLITGIANRDYAVVQAILLLTGTTVIVANLLADIAYGYVDPRIADARLKGRRHNAVLDKT
ncbi:ABC transporter permease [Pacificibacter sp. AS14]|uniref:ABC transporter permease n=1 Tax=Pacificibacter sp. AS14 TaxID=3135785 RepID=UPI003178C7A4